MGKLYEITGNIYPTEHICYLYSLLGEEYSRYILNAILGGNAGGILSYPDETHVGYGVTNKYNLVRIAPGISDCYKGTHSWIDLSGHPYTYDPIFGDMDSAPDSSHIIETDKAMPTDYIREINSDNASSLVNSFLPSEWPEEYIDCSNCLTGNLITADNNSSISYILNLLHKLECLEDGTNCNINTSMGGPPYGK